MFTNFLAWTPPERLFRRRQCSVHRRDCFLRDGAHIWHLEVPRSGGSEMIKHSELVDWFTRELRRDKEWTYGLRYDPMIKVRRFWWQIYWLEDLAPYNLRLYRAHLKKFNQMVL
ncbi:hypothetical protein quinque_005230 [Culex quinquefasciatus]